MTAIHQVIVRNIPPKGLDVVTATISKNQIQDLSQYVPSKCPEEFNNVFVTKFCHSSGKIALRFTFDDGIDQFGRRTIKTHTLIIDQSLYNKKTALYFLSPLINGHLTVEGNNLLTSSDFKDIPPSSVSSKLVEAIMSKKRVVLNSITKKSPLEIIHLFGTLDRIIPPQITSFFTFQSHIDQSLLSVFKKISLVYSDVKIDNALVLDSLESEKSEFPTIRALTEASLDLKVLRGLQKQFFLAVPEKRLNFRVHLRFGIKTFAHIRKTLEIGLHINDLVQVVVGPHKGEKAIIQTIDSENGILKVVLENDSSLRPITIAMSSVHLIQSQHQ
ncbi:MAG: hypothetical protein KAT16_05955 [Candidatus Heimdallarchaeota archaeon]|nr:hypothetical protein [Candidatus Heimdallarchaeota archaeon]